VTRERTIDAIVIGGGIAGAAAGCGLARRGRSVLLLERETVAGVHATGRNAAILRHGFGPPSDLALAMETARVVREGELGPIGLRRCGSLNPVSGEAGLERMRREIETLSAAGVEASAVDRDEAIRRVPLLDGCAFDAALACPADGVLDVHALHQALLAGIREEGGEVRVARGASELLTDDRGVCGVAIGEARLTSRLVIDAAGPWVDDLAVRAGARPLGLRPCRRHLLVTEPDVSIDPDWPVVWDVASPWYFRPETGGLLLSPCDEDELEPCDCREDERVIQWGVEKFVRLVPGLADLRVSRSWAGLRTLTPDGACVVGHDPSLPGLFRVAGLGGHGISAAGGLLRLVPDLALDGETALLDAGEVSPLRLF